MKTHQFHLKIESRWKIPKMSVVVGKTESIVGIGSRRVATRKLARLPCVKKVTSNKIWVRQCL
uniref:ORF2 n=1 Tax=Tobacco necrosis virus (strain D) TaxID=12056 RepID=A0A8F8N548_TNVD|nr:ORF2 [Tobacco necrosis virus D]